MNHLEGDLVQVVAAPPGVLEARIVRPPANLLNRQICHELRAVVGAAAEDDSVKVLLISSGLDGVFARHYDVAELEETSAKLREPGQKATGGSKHPFELLTEALASLPQLSVAALSGDATGGGLELALACDVRLAAASARLGLAETSIGLVPGGGGTQRLPRLIGTAAALELIATGRFVSGNAALRLGVVHHSWPEEEFAERVADYVRAMADRPALALRHAKALVTRAVETPLDVGLRAEAAAMVECLRDPEAIELMRRYVTGGQTASSSSRR